MNSNIAALRALVVMLALLLAGHAAPAQQAPSESGEYTPTMGQRGKDVIWIPTPDELVERMLEMAGVGSRDYVIDLGSGDGRTVITAAERFGANGLGIEYNPDMVALSIRNAERAGVTHKVKFVEGDIFESNFSQATVIAMYLLPSLNLRLRPKILDLRPGTRVVSHSFDMAEWQPDQTVRLGVRKAHLWIVPADVAGDWELVLPTERGEERWTLALDQEFQMLYGRVGLPEGSFRLMDGRMRGTEIRFDFIDASGNRREVSGSASSSHMKGTLRNQDGTSENWSAVRAELGAVSPRTGRLQVETDSKVGTDFALQPIGFVRSSFQETSEVPRGLGAKHTKEGVLEIRPELEAGLTDIEGFSHLFVIWVFDRSEGYELMSSPPSDNRAHGVFATRSPFRPNSLGLTVVELLRREGNRLYVRGVDMLDGTPILDVKPYLSSIPIEKLRRGWLAEAESRAEGSEPKP